MGNVSLYALAVVEGFAINEVIERKLAPVNGVLIGGSVNKSINFWHFGRIRSSW